MPIKGEYLRNMDSQREKMPCAIYGKYKASPHFVPVIT